MRRGILSLILVFFLCGVVAAYDLSEALDTTLSFTTGGNAGWFEQSAVSYYDSDAAQSGEITSNQRSWMRTTLDGPTTINFYWKVSSEMYMDNLGFYVDGQRYDKISGQVDWQQKTYDLGSGSRELEWRYYKDSSVSNGSDCGWVDKIELGSSGGGGGGSDPPPTGNLSGALDTTYSFTTGGNANWFGQSAVSYHDSDAAQSGDISHNQESWIRTTVDGDTTASFYWKVSSESGYDFLGFYVDGNFQQRISGQVDWHQATRALGPGSHELEWRYSKDSSVSGGGDCGWLDKLELESGGSEPQDPNDPSDPPAGDLSEALDTTFGTTTGGNAGWFVQSTTSYYDSDATQSGDISHNQQSWMRATVDGDTTASFYWKVSSESRYDFLEFYVDGNFQQRISGQVDWTRVTHSLGPGSHELKWRYYKDRSVSSGGDCGWVDKLELESGGSEPQDPNDPSDPPAGDISEALDTTLNFTMGGNADWYAQSAVSYYDSDAAQSGNISHNQESWMQSTVYGAGTLSFYWKVSSESYADNLEFYVNGQRRHRISGPTDWQHKTYTLNDGTNTLKWRYTKDYSVSNGSDCGWVDKVEWSSSGGGGSEPPPSGNLSDALDTTYSLSTGGSADWFAQSTMFYYGSDAAQSGDISDNQVTWMQTSVGETGTVSFYWRVSSEGRYDFLEFYADGDFQGRISGQTDWSRVTCPLGSGSHNLEWRYFKDGSVSSGGDCGWVDKLELESGGSEPQDPNDPDDPSDPPAGDLSEALDTTLNFTTGGDADWFEQFAVFYYDSDAAQSGNVSDNEESWMQTTVYGEGTLSFYWKVSSEPYADNLDFYVNSQRRDRISGPTDWQHKEYSLSDNTHTLKWQYAKDYSVSNGNDCGWVDKVEWESSGSSEPPDQNDPTDPPANNLADALDTILNISTGGGADWYAQSTTFYNNADAAQSGSIWHHQDSWMQTTISGTGTLSFYWKVFSESGYDFLELYIDGVLKDRISGFTDWQNKMYAISTSGFHVVEWVYAKDGSVSSGSDCGWVDQVEWDAAGTEPPPAGDAWLNINSSHYDSCCGQESTQHSLAVALEGLGSWEHYTNHTHWFVLDLGATYNIKKVKGCSNGHNAGYWDPINVSIYVSDDKADWGTPVATGINRWHTGYCCTNEYGQPYLPGEEVILQEYNTIPKNGRYIKVVIPETLDENNSLEFGRAQTDFSFKIFDAYGSFVSSSGDLYGKPPAKD